MEQQIGFCTASDGVRLAYATVGKGPPLVKAANWLSHLEFDWQSPVWRHWWRALAQSRTLVRYDQRGCGLSDWMVEDFSFDARVRDLESVVDALRLDRFSLLGMSSQGAPVAIDYAARHPERVDRLILFGASARGAARRGPAAREEREARLVLMRQGWGRDNPAYRQLFTSLFVPGANEVQMRWFNDLQRMSTSAENAVSISAESAKIDVVDRLSQISMPALILHSRHDAVVPMEEGCLIATSVPNAHFVPLESSNHVLLETEPAWQVFLAEVLAFLGVRGESHPSRAESASAPPGDGPLIRLDTRTAEVRVRGRRVRLAPKEYRALVLLHAKGGTLVSKEELASAVWPEYDGQVADYNIEQLLSRLRRKIEDDPKRPSLLLTVRGIGYRLITG